MESIPIIIKPVLWPHSLTNHPRDDSLSCRLLYGSLGSFGLNPWWWYPHWSAPFWGCNSQNLLAEAHHSSTRVPSWVDVTHQNSSNGLVRKWDTQPLKFLNLSQIGQITVQIWFFWGLVLCITQSETKKPPQITTVFSPGSPGRVAFRRSFWRAAVYSAALWATAQPCTGPGRAGGLALPRLSSTCSIFQWLYDVIWDAIIFNE